MRNILLIALLLAGCRAQVAETKNDSLSNETTSSVITPSANSTPTPVADEVVSTFVVAEERVNYTTYLEPGTEVFSDTLGGNPPIDFITEFLPVSVVSKSDARHGDNTCNQYFWYEIARTDTTSGWVHGAKVMQDLDRPSSAYDIGGVEYRLLFLQDTGVGASNDEGLTGCNEYVIPYFFDMNTSKFCFVKMTEDVESRFHLTSYNGWLAFMEGEGGSTSVQSVRYDENEDNYSMILNISLQDGGLAVDLRFTNDGRELKFYSISAIEDEEISDEPSESEHQ